MQWERSHSRQLFYLSGKRKRRVKRVRKRIFNSKKMVTRHSTPGLKPRHPRTQTKSNILPLFQAIRMSSKIINKPKSRLELVYEAFNFEIEEVFLSTPKTEIDDLVAASSENINNVSKPFSIYSAVPSNDTKQLEKTQVFKNVPLSTN